MEFPVCWSGLSVCNSWGLVCKELRKFCFFPPSHLVTNLTKSKDATSHYKILSDTVNNTNEIVKLVKFSPKRENLLGQIKSNIEMEDKEGGILASGLIKFCATRWTVRATCFQRVRIDNYDALLKLWNDCLETRLESDVSGRIIRCLKHR